MISKHLQIFNSNLIKCRWSLDDMLANGKETTCQYSRYKTCGLDPWVGKIPWRRAWQPTLVLLPGQSHRWGAWWATIHRVAKSRTRLKLLSTQHSHVSQRVILGNTRTSTHLDGPVNNFADSTGGSHFNHCNLHKQDVRKMFLHNMWQNFI